MKRILRSFATVMMGVCLTGATALAGNMNGNVVGNGGDAIEVGGATKVFDTVEYEESFMPNQLTDAWPAIDSQLTLVEHKLKKTGAYLRRILTGGMPIWWWVNVELKDIKDEGHTSIYVIFEKSQIAANTGDVIQINKLLWDKLNVESKTSLIMHEAMWTAVGSAYIGQGDNIRKLTRLLMNPSIAQYPAAALAGYIKQFVGTANSPLAVMADLDVEQLAVHPKFDVNEVVSDLGSQPVVTVLADSPVKGMMLTSFKANPTTKNLFMTDGPWNNPQAPRQIVNDIGSAGQINNLQPIRISEICGMSYGGYADWRLPTTQELQSMRALGLFNVRYPQSMTFRSKNEGAFSSSEWSVSSNLMFPIADSSGNKVIWVLSTSASGSISAVDPASGYKLGETGSSFWARYAEVICVRQ